MTAGLSTVPFVGGALSSLVDDYIPKVKEERLNEFLRDLVEAATAIQEDLAQVSEEYVHSDEFAFLFERCFKGATENYREEKLTAFRAILLNSLLPEAPDDDQKLFYLVIAESLAPVHIHILRVLVDPTAYDQRTGNRVGARSFES